MPALVNQPNVLQVVVEWAASLDSLLRSKLHFAWSGSAPTSATCATIAGDIRAFAQTVFVPFIDSDHTLTNVLVTDLTSPTAGNGSATGSTAGSRAGGFLPAEVCVLSSYHIARRYRGGKPRTYWPFGVSGDLANNSQWTSGFQSAVKTAVDAFMADVSTITVAGCTVGSQVSVSYYDGFVSVQNPITLRWSNLPLPRTVAIAPDVILSRTVDIKPASQRRRMLQTS